MWVVRHEIAHALHFEDKGTFVANVKNSYHGKEFKRFCKIVGCPATRYIPA
jgi:predicted SprT family Zn-dependent metalloprotease